MIGGNAVKPRAKRALTLERAELGDDLHQDFLSDLLGVLWPKDHADSDVVDPRLVPQDQLFQRRPVAADGLLDQSGIGRNVLSDFGEGIDHGPAPFSGQLKWDFVRTSSLFRSPSLFRSRFWRLWPLAAAVLLMVGFSGATGAVAIVAGVTSGCEVVQYAAAARAMGRECNRRRWRGDGT